MEKRIGSPRILQDQAARNLMQEIEALEVELQIEGGIFYYEYPLFRDDSGKLYRPQLILVTKTHGLFLFSISDEIAKADRELTNLDSIVFAKLIKSNLLRKSKREVIVPIKTVIYTTHPATSIEQVESKIASSIANLRSILQEDTTVSITDDQWKELTSLLANKKRGQATFLAASSTSPAAASSIPTPASPQSSLASLPFRRAAADSHRPAT